MINIKTARNDYLVDGETLTQLLMLVFMFVAAGILISPAV